ncbi:ORF1310 [White spot syndrome virus]|uniref:ORF1310 n=1 Tax=White spot syndrome virus TaxID=342409 RepID=A0A2D3I650_9VIRU|nr:ORF1310 [White spot syndrome virus]
MGSLFLDLLLTDGSGSFSVVAAVSVFFSIVSFSLLVLLLTSLLCSSSNDVSVRSDADIGTSNSFYTLYVSHNFRSKNL